MKHTFLARVFTTLPAGILVLLVATASNSHAQVAGFRGRSYEGAGSYPTGTKPESKLWWNDGSWWGCLWSAPSRSFTIQRLNVDTQSWMNTGVAVDRRPNSHADCLWDGTKLYIASHRFTLQDDTGSPLELYRYGYDPVAKNYELDVGFPTLIGDAATEAMVIDKDSTGTLWAVWMLDKRVRIAHTLGDDRSWSVPAIHPLNSADLTPDDLCALVPFQGDKLGILWSNQVDDAFVFTSHRDGDPDTAWAPLETVLGGPQLADDHISMKAAADGRVFVALKPETDEIRLAVRSLNGSWSTHLIAGEDADWGRPFLLLDEEHQNVLVFGTSPKRDGAIHVKTSPMGSISFVTAGPGVPVIDDPSSPFFNHVTSTKQSVNGTTGLVVMASHQVTERYWHSFAALGGPRPAPPVASFTADPAAGPRPLIVQFIDSSSGTPTAWSWDFGDGSFSTEQHPVHAYASAGSYGVTLLVTNALGGDALTRADLIRVDPPPTVLTLRPIGDAQVHDQAPDTSYGSLTTLRVLNDEASRFHSYVEFFVPPLGRPIASARLRLFCVQISQDSGVVHLTEHDWDEPTLTWDNAPALAGTPIGSLGSPVPGTWTELDVSPWVNASGTVSFGIRKSGGHSTYFSSRQGSNPPELVITLQPGPVGAPTAGFEAEPLAGRAPLTVQFADTSNGPVSSWRWDFGDGATSNVQNPSHAFAQPGAYRVFLTVTGSSGVDTLVRSSFVRVSLPPPESASPADKQGVP
jgi:PKD repeat protein